MYMYWYTCMLWHFISKLVWRRTMNLHRMLFDDEKKTPSNYLEHDPFACIEKVPWPQESSHSNTCRQIAPALNYDTFLSFRVVFFCCRKNFKERLFFLVRSIDFEMGRSTPTSWQAKKHVETLSLSLISTILIGWRVIVSC